MAGDACVREVHRGGGAVLCSEARSCVLGVQKMCRTSNTEYVGWDRAFKKNLYKKLMCDLCVRTRWLLISFDTIDIYIYNYVCVMCVFSANDQ